MSEETAHVEAATGGGANTAAIPKPTTSSAHNSPKSVERRNRRKSILRANNLDMEFETVTFDENQGTGGNAGRGMKGAKGQLGARPIRRVCTGTMARLHATLGPQNFRPVLSMVDKEFYKFLKEKHINSLLDSIATQRALINTLLGFAGVHAIEFQLYAPDDLVLLLMEERLNQIRLRQMTMLKEKLELIKLHQQAHYKLTAVLQQK